jgi:hypothetical protein
MGLNFEPILPHQIASIINLTGYRYELYTHKMQAQLDRGKRNKSNAINLMALMADWQHHKFIYIYKIIIKSH